MCQIIAAAGWVKALPCPVSGKAPNLNAYLSILELSLIFCAETDFDTIVAWAQNNIDTF
jgi:hypothetical protein